MIESGFGLIDDRLGWEGVPGFVIRAMSSADASVVAGWRYPGRYAFYNADADPEDLAELLDPSEWGRRYFAADDVEGDLVGFFVFKHADDNVEIGLGLRPDLTSKGQGGPFLASGLRFAADRFGARSFSLTVVAWNERAITVYRRAGFQDVEHFQHQTNGGIHPFLRMSRGSIEQLPQPTPFPSRENDAFTPQDRRIAVFIHPNSETGGNAGSHPGLRE